jgi:DNA helicase-2/ATP-dependent DNA helicase PcrA
VVEAGLDINSETREILENIKSGNNFLLSGGAGSGKTYSLVETIKAVLAKEPTKPIACITYTNAAVREIENRVNHHNLHVSTIHDFLWDSIKTYQSDLKTVILSLIANEEDEFKRFKLPDGIEPTADLFANIERGIQYKEYVRLKEGIISHDEVLLLACHMYKESPKLCGITKDQFPFIFVDEYQDTSPYVVEILLNHLNVSPKPCVVGFFGDVMQAIYPGTVGNIDAFQGDGPGQVRQVKKEQNRRNPRLVIDLANKLRTDGLTQCPSDDLNAPNMQDGTVKEGSVQFLYSESDDLVQVRNFLAWGSETKELNLTHNLIAGKAGFAELMEIYDGDKILHYVKRIRKYIKENELVDDFSGKTFREVVEQLKTNKTGSELNKVNPTAGMQVYIDSHDEAFQISLNSPYDEISSIYIDKEQLLDDKKDDASDLGRPSSQRDDLIKHLFRIQQHIYFYQEGMVNDFIRATDFNISSVRDKAELKQAIDSLVNVGDKTVGQIIDKANNSGICIIDDRLTRFQRERRYVYDRVTKIPFKAFQNLYKYLEGHTPFSTQHKTKGAEYPNVLVILDNGRWNSYNFRMLFEETGTESVLERTQKIFYVCCTRVKESLAVFYHQPPASVLDKAITWFGKDNVINLDASEEAFT